MAIGRDVWRCMVDQVTQSVWIDKLGRNLNELFICDASLLTHILEVVVQVTEIGAWWRHRVWKFLLVVEPVAIEAFEVGSHTVFWSFRAWNSSIKNHTWK